MTQFLSLLPYVGLLIAFLVASVLTIKILALRRVVSTNEVHIVQTSKRRVSYGGQHATDKEDTKPSSAGNTYYEWPSWIPVIGVTKSVLPLAVFSLDLNNYQAYDRDRLPFLVHLLAFFRIADSNAAAERVASFLELQKQLTGVVQGAVRSILATHTIHEIMKDRDVFANSFTEAVRKNAENWGVETVKALELMDIKDSEGSQVIHNIMEKKRSHVEMEARTEVADNNRQAEMAEIVANREIELQKQEATQQVGLRTVEAERKVELQRQAKDQEVKEQQRLTKEKDMAVLQVEKTKYAEIEKQVQVVIAEQNKQTAVLAAEANKATQILIADGTFESMRREAEGKFEVQRQDAAGTKLLGEARASAESAMLLAPVTAQITLADKIGKDASYQSYLVSIKKVEADQAIGVAQAEALSQAEIKVFANTGSVTQGINSLSELLSTKGGTAIGGALEALAATPVGQDLLSKAGIGKKTNSTVTAPAKQ